MSNKTEKPTPYKLKKTKEQGRISKSTEWNTAILVALSFLALAVLWKSAWQDFESFIKAIFTQSSRFEFSLDSVTSIQKQIGLHTVAYWLPCSVIILSTIIITHVLQDGFTLHVKPLLPDTQRINPIRGWKKWVSLKTLQEWMKTIVKLLTGYTVLYFFLKTYVPVIFVATSSHPILFLPIAIKCIKSILIPLFLCLLCIAYLDKRYTQWKFNQDLRMTKQEVKEEYKQREGDPKIKSKIRTLQSQLRQKTASLQAVKESDVVITNPEHLAIALKYDKDNMPAPKVVCKAQDTLAAEVKKIAQQKSIPIIENKPFAQMLYHTLGLNQYIQPSMYSVAASIFKDLYARKPKT